ncbi:hypothetical protein [Paenibacillus senegalensis]|uniref:hypothetical protein n=1 Tax=Paenibacillus senegalensis TaxID=1465766 RepID=UPI000288CC73|nr:hypothetical protein [Paenibacillus senegalensis]
MDRSISNFEKVFAAGLMIIMLFMVTHDWIPLGGLNDLEGIRSQHTTSELVSATLFNFASILIVFGLAMWFLGKAYPLWVRIWLVAHLGGIFAGAMAAWWIPYWFGADDNLVMRYDAMFGSTHAFLPVMNGIVPNTIHVLFHLVLVIVWLQSIYLAFAPGYGKKRLARSTAIKGT